MKLLIKKSFLLLWIGLLCSESFAFPNLTGLLPVHKKLIIILLGAPGTGKGTQADLLNRELNFPHISPGQLLRNEVNNHSPIGTQVAQIMQSGAFVPNSFILDILFSRTSQDDAQKGYILDGFPRTMELASEFFQTLHEPYVAVVFTLSLNTDVLWDRISKRRVCVDCGQEFPNLSVDTDSSSTCPKCSGIGTKRADDNLDAFDKRISLFEHHHQDTVHFLKERNSKNIFNINGSQSVEAVHEEIGNHLMEVLTRE